MINIERKSVWLGVFDSLNDLAEKLPEDYRNSPLLKWDTQPTDARLGTHQDVPAVMPPEAEAEWGTAAHHGLVYLGIAGALSDLVLTESVVYHFGMSRAWK